VPNIHVSTSNCFRTKSDTATNLLGKLLVHGTDNNTGGDTTDITDTIDNGRANNNEVQAVGKEVQLR
jgi:hypothetical protein